jgi:hypothetical protein
MFSNGTFYPTPENLASKMVAKINGHPAAILEPSAGKGDLLDAVNRVKYDRWSYADFSVIEKDPTLQSVLKGKGYLLLDDDFLRFSGPDKFDLIIANPPFNHGAEHLLKAIDIMYSGQIIFLLNAETIRNPFSMIRKELVKKLKALNAEIEFHTGAFHDAERKTDVDVALINIVIDRNIEEDLFDGADATVADCHEQIEENYEITTGNHIEDLVAEYNQVVQVATDTILGYYRNSKKIWPYIGLNREPEKHYSGAEALTEKVRSTLNGTLRLIRRDFWHRTLDLKEVRSRLTTKRKKEFEQSIKEHSNMDFTENNIRAFLLNLINCYDDTLTKAVLEIFNLFTIKHCWEKGGVFTDNIHYFDGWKTNNAFRVGKKVIIPVHGGHGNGPFLSWMDRNKWELSYSAEEALRDIDIVMNYFDGCRQYTSVTQALNRSFADGQSRNIRSTYFIITAYKKGTLHLTFRDENILRRFNVAACLGKEWLPMDYGQRPYEDLAPEEQNVVDTFEIGGAAEYTKNVGQSVFENTWSQPLLLQAA